MIYVKFRLIKSNRSIAIHSHIRLEEDCEMEAPGRRMMRSKGALLCASQKRLRRPILIEGKSPSCPICIDIVDNYGIRKATDGTN